jgi:hypothetical protein
MSRIVVVSETRRDCYQALATSQLSPAGVEDLT